MKEQELLKMPVGKTEILIGSTDSEQWEVLRVPGGWIYHIDDSSASVAVYVPEPRKAENQPVGLSYIPRIAVNFMKTGTPLTSFHHAFMTKTPIKVEFLNPKGNGPSDTIAGSIFITSMELTDFRKWNIRFVTLFHMEGMMPGTYEMENINSSRFMEENQFPAQRIKG